MVGHLTGPPYMFFPEDTFAAVAEGQLVPSAELVAAVLRAADKVSFEDLR